MKKYSTLLSFIFVFTFSLSFSYFYETFRAVDFQDVLGVASEAPEREVPTVTLNLSNDALGIAELSTDTMKKGYSGQLSFAVTPDVEYLSFSCAARVNCLDVQETENSVIVTFKVDAETDVIGRLSYPTESYGELLVKDSSFIKTDEGKFLKAISGQSQMSFGDPYDTK